MAVVQFEKFVNQADIDFAIDKFAAQDKHVPKTPQIRPKNKARLPNKPR